MSQRNSPEISDPHVNCINVFQQRGMFDFQPLGAQEATIPRLLELENTGTGAPGSGCAVNDREAFATAWERFSTGQLAGLDWSNVVVAGGAVLAALLPNSQDQFAQSDIDMFLYGLTPAQANEKVRHIYETVRRNNPGGAAASCVRTTNAITILNEYPNRHIQIVLRIYKSPAEVVMGFDIDCCSVCFDGRDVWAIPRARRAITKRYNLVSMSRRSLTYEVRLYKYSKRGFAVAVPGFDASRVDPELFRKETGKVAGLAKLLLLQHRGRTTRGGSKPAQRPAAGVTALFAEDRAQWEALHSQESQSDYADVEIPWGPHWSPAKITRLLDYRDKAQFFSHGRTDLKHKHLFVCGIEEALEGKASWCKWCSQQWSGPVGEGGVGIGPISWLTENPGTQLLTGSFHPVSDSLWDDGAYAPADVSSVRALCNACLAGEASSISATSEAEPLTGLPVSAFVGLGVAQRRGNSAVCATAAGRSSAEDKIAAAFVGDSAALEALLRIDSSVPEKHAAGPLHVAAFYGNTDCVRSLLKANRNFADAVDHQGRTALHLAMLGGSEECARVLKELCPQLASATDYSGALADDLAAAGEATVVPRGGRPATVWKPQIAAPERYTVRDLRGEFPLLAATASGDEARVAQLSHSEEVDPYGITALHVACINGFDSLVSRLLSRADSDAIPRDCHGQSPLHYVVASGLPSAEAAKAILAAHPAWASAKNWLGQTSLQCCTARLAGMTASLCRQPTEPNVALPPPELRRRLLAVRAVLQDAASGELPMLSTFPLPSLPPSLIPFQAKQAGGQDVPWCVDFLAKKAARVPAPAPAATGSTQPKKKEKKPKQVKKAESEEEGSEEEEESEEDIHVKVPSKVAPKAAPKKAKKPAPKKKAPRAIPAPKKAPAPKWAGRGFTGWGAPTFGQPAPTATGGFTYGQSVSLFGQSVQPARPVFGQPSGFGPTSGFGQPAAPVPATTFGFAAPPPGIFARPALAQAAPAASQPNAQLAQAARNALGGFPAVQALQNPVSKLLALVARLFRAGLLQPAERAGLKDMILTDPIDPRLVALPPDSDASLANKLKGIFRTPAPAPATVPSAGQAAGDAHWREYTQQLERAIRGLNEENATLRERATTLTGLLQQLGQRVNDLAGQKK